MFSFKYKFNDRFYRLFKSFAEHFRRKRDANKPSPKVLKPEDIEINAMQPMVDLWIKGEFHRNRYYELEDTIDYKRPIRRIAAPKNRSDAHLVAWFNNLYAIHEYLSNKHLSLEGVHIDTNFAKNLKQFRDSSAHLIDKITDMRKLAIHKPIETVHELQLYHLEICLFLRKALVPYIHGRFIDWRWYLGSEEGWRLFGEPLAEVFGIETVTRHFSRDEARGFNLPLI